MTVDEAMPAVVTEVISTMIQMMMLMLMNWVVIKTMVRTRTKMKTKKTKKTEAKPNDGEGWRGHHRQVSEPTNSATRTATLLVATETKLTWCCCCRAATGCSALGVTE